MLLNFLPSYLMHKVDFMSVWVSGNIKEFCECVLFIRQQTVSVAKNLNPYALGKMR